MELDCCAGDILNSLDVQGNPCLSCLISIGFRFLIVDFHCTFFLDGIKMNPGLSALWDEEIERRKVKNMNLDNINPPVSQPRSQAVPTSSHVFYKTGLSKQLREYASEAVCIFN